MVEEKVKNSITRKKVVFKIFVQVSCEENKTHYELLS